MYGAFNLLRDPKYTGKNRCWKCTVVNVLLTLILTAVIAGINLIAGSVVLVVAFGTIYFRGYLIPGTPWLTKRYLPHGALAWFGTHGTGAADDRTIESVLVEAEAVRPAGDDLVLDQEFKRRWREQIREYRGAEDDVEMLRAIGGLGELNSEDVTVTALDAAFVATVDGVRVGRWVSRGAFLADAAAARVLELRFDGWDRLSFDERTAVLGGLRLWLDWCPLCDGHVALGTETVESCCRTVDVVAGTCRDCGRRVFEVDAPDDGVAVESA